MREYSLIKRFKTVVVCLLAIALLMLMSMSSAKCDETDLLNIAIHEDQTIIATVDNGVGIMTFNEVSSTIITNYGKIRARGQLSCGIHSDSALGGTINNYSSIATYDENSCVIKGEGGDETLNLFCDSQITGIIDLSGGADTVNIYDGNSSQDISELAILNAKTINYAPVADAGNNQRVVVDKLVFLNGIGSSNSDGYMLEHKWEFVSMPDGSSSVLYDDTTMTPTFVPDTSGEYEVFLTVNDDTVDSIVDTKTVTVYTPQTVITAAQEAEKVVEGLDISAFKEPIEERKELLIRRLNHISRRFMRGINNEKDLRIIDRLLRRMNGCATKGELDKNDWIVDCDAQAIVYSVLLSAKD